MFWLLFLRKVKYSGKSRIKNEKLGLVALAYNLSTYEVEAVFTVNTGYKVSLRLYRTLSI